MRAKGSRPQLKINNIVNDRLNCNKKSLCDRANGISIFEGSDGIDIEDTLTTPS